MKSVLILGGGFAGVEAAIYLKKNSYDVTLVSDRKYLYIYPISIWVPTRESTFDNVCMNLDALSNVHNFKLIVSAITKIDAKQDEYTLDNGNILKDYDHVVLALGASKMQHKGLQNTLSICAEPEQSVVMRDKLDALIQRGSGKICFGFGGNPKDMSAVRGGPAFEVLFNIHNLLTKKGIRDNYELTFFAPMEKPGKKMGDKALKMMDISFNKLNIQKHFGKKIKMFEQDSIVFEDDSKLESDYTMFIPAGNGNPLVANSGLTLNNAGFIVIDDFCRVHIDDEETNIYAVGDIAALQGANWRAKQGHIAEVMARNVAHNIMKKDKGSNDFKGYQEHINILCVMDTGNGASFIYRDHKKALMIPMPIVGHWLKKGWGKYHKLSKFNKVPRIPGM